MGWWLLERTCPNTLITFDLTARRGRLNQTLSLNLHFQMRFSLCPPIFLINSNILWLLALLTLLGVSCFSFLRVYSNSAGWCNGNITDSFSVAASSSLAPASKGWFYVSWSFALSSLFFASFFFRACCYRCCGVSGLLCDYARQALRWFETSFRKGFR